MAILGKDFSELRVKVSEGDTVSFGLDEGSGNQLYVLEKGRIWLLFELTNADKQALLKALVKDWLS